MTRHFNATLKSGRVVPVTIEPFPNSTDNPSNRRMWIDGIMMLSVYDEHSAEEEARHLITRRCGALDLWQEVGPTGETT